jgi:hypothetical protein
MNEGGSNQFEEIIPKNEEEWDKLFFLIGNIHSKEF